MRNGAIKVGDTVEESGTDSGLWKVLRLYRESEVFKRGVFAQLSCVDAPHVVTYVPVSRLVRV
jgi:hypothetical protein